MPGLTTACTPAGENIPTGKRYEFNNILDITYTPDTLTRCGGWFTDAGSWMGFTLPQKDHWVNGFCGPFSLDMNRRQWMAQSAVTVRYADQANVIFTPDSTCYFPGELYLSASSEEGKIIQRLNFLDASTALLRIHSDAGKELSLTASQWGKEIQVQTDQNTVIARHPSGEIVALTFTPDVSVKGTDNNYQAKINGSEHDTYVAISFYTGEKELSAGLQKAQLALSNPQEGLKANKERWEGYLTKILRKDMKPEYDRIAVKAVVTLISNWRTHRSKPPLVSWTVDEIFTHTNDTAFISEMYPQLMAYYKWWYNKRDHNRNGMCEYGSTDGTLEAAAWESGMDNAIRFDDAKMLKNDGAEDAWSMDQESVDLNAYLALECKLLKKFAGILGVTFDGPDYSSQVADYFFDKEKGFFFDRRLKDGSFIQEPGCEAYTPLWTKVATADQVKAMLPLLTDTAKFSTYIPFPTVAADHPKYNPRGYWRGPIWLDQTYFAIRGLRNYGYNKMADEYTLQVFDRLQGLKEGAPIHENYGTHTGELLKAPHFSWSSSHLLMLYDDYGK